MSNISEKKFDNPIKQPDNPIEVGARFRLLRNTADLTIAEFVKLSGVSHPSVSYWENGLISIKANSIAKVLMGFDKGGINVTETWLRQGIGAAPTYKGMDIDIPKHLQKNAKIIDMVPSGDTQQAIILAEEMKLFASLNQAIITKVDHSRLLPFLEKGDLVGGLWQAPETLTERAICIFKLQDDNKTYIDYSDNPVLSTDKREKIAPIIRVWRLTP